MDDNELKHWGVLGMKWGVRRYQNKDGSLTPAGRKHRSKLEGNEKEETIEEKRSRLLKSTNAKELYENRSILSTAEINERINRIDTEKRLSELADKSKKSGMDRVDKVLKIGRKANEIYEFTNTPIIKALKKKFGLEEVEKHIGLDKIYEMRDKLSDKELSDALKRASTEKTIKKMLDESAQEAARAKQQQAKMEYWNNSDPNKRPDTNGNVSPQKRDSEPYRYSYSKSETSDTSRKVAALLDYPKNNTPVNKVSEKDVSIGKSYVAGLLEEPNVAGLLEEPKE